MPARRRPKARRAMRPRAKTSKPISEGTRRIATSQLGARSAGARDRSLHVLAAVRNDPDLSFTGACKLQGVKPRTAQKYCGSALYRSKGLVRVRKSDRLAATLYVPDAHGNSVPLQTHSSRERLQASQYLRDLGRYLRGQKNALAGWHGKKIAGVELVTAGRTIVAIEPSLSEFSLYRAFNGGVA
jgi:hypothetical protein